MYAVRFHIPLYPGLKNSMTAAFGQCYYIYSQLSETLMNLLLQSIRSVHDILYH